MSARVLPFRAVAVTGLHRGENPQPGASVIASLRRAYPSVRVVGFSYDPLESSLFSPGNDCPDAAYLVPFPGAGTAALLERIAEISKTEPLGYVIPCLDSEIDNYLALQGSLHALGIECILPSAQSLQDRSKTGLYDFCQRIGQPIPLTMVAPDPWSVERCAAEIGYPVYVKGRLYNAHLAQGPGELAAAYEDIVAVWGWPVVVQQAVAGEEYDVTGLGDGLGGIVASCTIRKLLRTSNGKGFAGIVVDDPALNLQAKNIIAALKWNGPFELEFLKSPGRPHALMEVNPRFPAWIDFPSQIGCNLPALLFERLLGQQPQGTPINCAPGQMFIRHSVDLIGNFGDFAAMAGSGARVFTDAPHITTRTAL